MNPLQFSKKRELAGRVALITGGGSGIGRTIARELARHGAHVAVVARHIDQLNDTVKMISSEGGLALAVTADICNSKEVADAVQEVESQFGPIDLLLSNAGQWRPMEALWKADKDEWENTVATNIFGTRSVLASVIPGMVSRQFGRIIVIASSTPLFSHPYISAYASSKAFLIKLAEEVAAEVREYGVQVFSVHPGTCNTKMTREMRKVNAATGYAPWLEQVFKDGKANKPADSAELVLRLFAGEADEFSGSFFDVNHDLELILKYLRQCRSNGLHLTVSFPPGTGKKRRGARSSIDLSNLPVAATKHHNQGNGCGAAVAEMDHDAKKLTLID
jgi:NAD(P)-dependent dehydrogenase (short-subunit alcohol dehydrogenase family)